MNKKFRRLLIYGEKRLRILLMGFCIYSTIYVSVFNLFPEYAVSIVNNYIFIIIGSIFSFCGGLVANDEIEEIKKKYEWDWVAETKSDYLCTEWVGLVTIGVFYFMVQMGVAAIFFPGTDQIKIGEHYVYPYLFTLISILIYIMYRLTIIKIELKETKEETL